LTEILINMNQPPLDSAGPRMLDYLHALPQYVLPHHLLSRIMLKITRSRIEPWKNLLIKAFIHHYKVDMSLAKEPNPEAYPSFNSFFTRELRQDARPVISGAGNIACPVDGKVSQAGVISDGEIFQAKGYSYSLATLLGGNEARVAQFRGGRFATLYLSPKDYHRIHMPLDGRLREMVHIPGRLFSVSPSTTRIIPGLFARNERVVTIFDTPVGPMAMVLVGAIFVASIETVWSGVVTPPTFRHIRTWQHDKKSEQHVNLQQGQEMGRFNMGSTVIVLFGPEANQWNPELRPGATIRMGQLLGNYSHKNVL
jgi:phosphatidylserine decarboxylase